MQFTTGLRSILSHHGAYRWFRRLTGSERLHRILVGEYIRPQAGDVVLDVGCGPADILPWLPGVQYHGIDLSRDYVEAARRRHGDRGRFLLGSVDALDPAALPACDLVLALGVFHHLDDEQVAGLLTSVRRVLKPGGRLVSYDPCFTRRQNPVARAIHRFDRGGNVRFDGPMTRLVRRVFPQAVPVVRRDMCLVPSTVILFNVVN
jgi:SAM-dependent methyltransferase